MVVTESYGSGMVHRCWPSIPDSAVCLITFGETRPILPSRITIVTMLRHILLYRILIGTDAAKAIHIQEGLDAIWTQ